MPILIGNTRIGLPNRRSFTVKQKPDKWPLAIERETNHDGESSVVTEQQRLFINIQGPEKQTWTIVQLADGEEPDAMQIATWKRPFARLIGLSGMVAEALSMYTAYYQVQTVMEIRRDHKPSTWEIFLAWFIIGINFMLTSPNIPLVIVKLRTYWGRFRPRLRLVGTDVPNVDVVIPCCRESIDVLQDTIMAAIALDYPEDRFRVIVTDDGGSTQLESWIAELGQRNLYYTARDKNSRTGFKAGNLNHAVQFITQRLGEPSEFIASLDADMIPERNWLRAIAAHMVLDPKLGVVCPSQSFYNFPDNDPLYQSQLQSWRCTDVIRDFSGISWNTGSGFIIRRQALIDIGGFPTHSLTEDVLSSMMMMAKGWTTGYLAESLQYGLMPDSYLAHIKQFTRWNLGGVQMAAHFRFYLFKSHTGLLTIWQRLLGMSYGIMSVLVPFFTVIEIIATPYYLLNGVSLVYFADIQSLRFLLRIRCATVLARFVHYCHLGLMSDLRLAIRDEALSQYMAPYHMLAIVRSFILPKRFGGTAPGFTSSGSIAASVNERSAVNRAPLSARFRHIVIHCGVWFHLTVALALSFTVAYRISCILMAYPPDLHGHRDWHGVSVTLLRNVLWPYPGWLVSLLACLTPIQYALLPPDVPAREDLMGDRDEKGARYPTAHAKESRFTWINIDFAQLYLLTVIPYSVFLFVASWWI